MDGIRKNAALAVGATLQNGKYIVEKMLGQGGFGITYLCQQTNLGKHVAIKEFFFSQFCERDDNTSHVTVPTVGNRDLVEKFRRKFVKEAKLIGSKLSHPSIVRVSDWFDENGTSYYVMDYIEGRSLADMLNERGRLDVDEAIKIIDNVGNALEYVHARNINHLDIKPANIMLENASNNVVLIDFGVAKQYDIATGEATTTTPVGRTPGYAPPEQYKVGGVGQFSPESDIYALGATLYKMLIGETPPDALEVVSQDGLPPLPDFIPEPVCQAITAAMQTAKKNRPHSVAEFLEMLHASSIVGDEETEVADVEPDVIVIDSGQQMSPEPLSQFEPDTELVQQEPTDDSKPQRRWLLWCVGVVVAVVAFVVMTFLQRNGGQQLIDVPKDSVEVVVQADTVAFVEQEHQSVPQQEQQLQLEPERVVAEVMEQPVRQQQSQPEPEQVVPEIVQQPVQQQEPQQPQPEPEQAAPEITQQPEPIPAPEPQPSQDILSEIKMVYVSGGTFTMGGTSEQGSDAWSDEKPAHSVALGGYYIGKYEVTQKLWKAVMGSNPSGFKGDNLPVENVSWNDVQEFLKKLNAMTGKQYRLPTEAEWEFAARGGNSSRGYKYSGGNIDNIAWYGNNSGDKTHAVGTKLPNELGIYDMSGNVYEWCQDWFGNYNGSLQNNPKGAKSGSNRVRRGGCWSGYDRYCRVSCRNNAAPSFRSATLGFRLAL